MLKGSTMKKTANGSGSGRTANRYFGASRLLEAAAGFELGHWGRGWSRAMVGMILAAACMPAFAGPEGEQVVRGNVGITRDGSTTLIRASDRAIINYRSFDIRSGETVRFLQPSANARVLNRIDGASPTRIDGNLFANGRVYFVNPAGVYFGQNSRVDVHGLIVAAGRMSNADFMNGIDRFTDVKGAVVNEGRIDAGFAALIGSHVNNAGTIVSNGGTIIMGSADEAMIGTRTGNVFVRLSGEAGKAAPAGSAAVENSGTVDAGRGSVVVAAGDVYSLAVRASGTIRGRDVKVQGQGTGIVQIQGSIDASDHTAGAKGGTVEVTGQKVGLFGANIDASGASGGGQINVGGGFQGSGDLRRAEVTAVDKSTMLRADAINEGDGGVIVAWADHTTKFHGSLSSRGGQNSGNGGLVETSGKVTGTFSPETVDVSAPSGRGGTWLIDPRNVTIAPSGTAVERGQWSGTIEDPDDNLFYDAFVPFDDNAVVDVDEIIGRLATGTNVRITTDDDGSTAVDQDGDITLSAGAPIIVAPASDAILELRAANDIILLADITASGANKLNVRLTANQNQTPDPDRNAGDVDFSAQTINTNGGTLTVSGVNVSAGAVTNSGGVLMGGVITLNSSIATNGLSGSFVQFNGPVTLAAPLTINSGLGDLVATSTISAGIHGLILAGGEVSLGGAVTGSDALTISGGTVGTPIVIAGTPAGGVLDLSAAEIALIGNGSGAGFNSITIGSSGQTANTTIDGDVSFNDPTKFDTDTGIIAVNGSVTGADNSNITFDGPTTVSGTRTVSAGSGLVDFNSTLALGSSTFTVRADEIDFDGGDNTVTGTGASIVLEPGNGVTEVEVGGGSNAGPELNITAGLGEDLRAFTDDFGTFTIGSASQSSRITLADGLSMSDAATFRTGALGDIFGQTLIGTGNASFVFSGSTEIGAITTNNGSVRFDNAATLNGNITTTGGTSTTSVRFDGAVTLGGDVTIDVIAGEIITNSSAATVNAATHALVLKAGEMTLGGAITGTGTLALESGSPTTIPIVVAGTPAASQLDLSAAELLRIGNGSGVGFASITIGSSGQTQNTTIGGDVAFNDPTRLLASTGTIAVNGSVTGANNSNITFDGPTTVSGTRTVDAGSGTVDFNSTVALGSSTFTVKADEIDFDGGNNSVTGTAATMKFEPGQNTTPVVVGGTASNLNELNLTSGSGEDLFAFQDGFGSFEFGSTTQTANLTLTNGLLLRDPSTFRTGSGGNTIVAGSLDGNGNASLTFDGPTQVGGNITTQDQAIRFNATSSSSANAQIIAGTGTITLGAAYGASGNTLLLNADEIDINGALTGTSTLTIRGAINTPIVLGGTPVSNQLDLTTAEIGRLGSGFASIRIGNSSQAANTTVSSTTNFSAPVTFDTGLGQVLVNARLTGTAFTFNTGAGVIAVNAPLDGTAFAFNGPTTLAEDISSAGGDVTFNDAVTVSGSRFVTATSAIIDVNSTVDLDGGTLTLRSTGINLDGGANSVSGPGILALTTPNAATSIGITGATGTLQISQTDLDAVASSVTALNIGTAGTGAHDIAMNAASFKTATRFFAPATGGTVVIGSSGAVDAIVNTGGGFTFAADTDTPASISLNANITTSGGAVAFNDHVLLGDDVTINTANATPAGAIVGFDRSIVSDGNLNDRDLVVTLGTGGIVSFGGDIGGAANSAVGSLQVTGASNFTSSATVRTVGLAAADSVTFDGTLDASADLAITAGVGNVQFNGLTGSNTTPSTLIVTTAGTIDVNAAMTVTNSVDLNGDAVNVNAAIGTGTFGSTGGTFTSTTDGDITTATTATINQTGAVSVSGDILTSDPSGIVSITSGNDGTGDLSFGSTPRIAASTIGLTSGNGGLVAVVDAATGTPLFTGATLASAPNNFSITQDAAVTDATLPAASQFGAAFAVSQTLSARTNYSVTSQSNTITLPSGFATTKLDNAYLTLNTPDGDAITIGQTFSPASLQVNGPLTISDALTLTAADSVAGRLDFTDTISILADTVLAGTEINFANTVTPTGTPDLSLEPVVDATPVQMGAASDSGATVLDITSADFANIGAGFGTVFIGRTTGTGGITIAGPLNSPNALVFRGASGVVQLCDDLTTSGASVNFALPVVVCGDVEVNTTGGGNPTGADITFGTGNSANMTELMRIKGTGNVGINTAAPQYKLDIVSG
ncbi:MAG: filamentous hemagglutinin N-terminal domain-containing protein, partial [Phycisphaerales bacterium]